MQRSRVADANRPAGVNHIYELRASYHLSAPQPVDAGFEKRGLPINPLQTDEWKLDCFIDSGAGEEGGRLAWVAPGHGSLLSGSGLVLLLVAAPSVAKIPLSQS